MYLAFDCASQREKAGRGGLRFFVHRRIEASSEHGPRLPSSRHLPRRVCIMAICCDALELALVCSAPHTHSNMDAHSDHLVVWGRLVVQALHVGCPTMVPSLGQHFFETLQATTACT